MKININQYIQCPALAVNKNKTWWLIHKKKKINTLEAFIVDKDTKLMHLKNKK